MIVLGGGNNTSGIPTKRSDMPVDRTRFNNMLMKKITPADFAKFKGIYARLAKNDAISGKGGVSKETSSANNGSQSYGCEEITEEEVKFFNKINPLYEECRRDYWFAVEKAVSQAGAIV
ncbi:MAG: hypothetical protein WC506_02690 [Candidatus Micrarchaeia archaeon]